ncbi:hypothetical protein BDDG_12859 [Blastomyces dermatitidis ATCC 18188]|uniref:Uncharacterized protein n=1 Tax=Ajellomyces dermatitidis (strain ATCC 18188 / CBS 674.68) TaxID=653446 RepID=A0A0J9ER26_AJEDA|nr:hypothetical protein BDDG_12859 [Blastomyces dermatitidis ATCC 18188]
MKSVAIALKVSNTSISSAEKVKLEIEKVKLNIERVKLEIEKKKITMKKKKIAIEKTKLNIENMKLAVQQKILRSVNNHYKDQKVVMKNLTNLINSVREKAQCIFIEINTVDESSSDKKSVNSDNSLLLSVTLTNLSITTVNSLSLFFSDLLTLMSVLSPQTYKTITETTFKCLASNHSETSTLKCQMINDSVSQIMTNLQTSICKFSDVINESNIAGNEDYERNLIQLIQKDLDRSVHDFQ